MKKIENCAGAMFSGCLMTKPHYAHPITKKEATEQNFEALFREAVEARKEKRT